MSDDVNLPSYCHTNSLYSIWIIHKFISAKTKTVLDSR